ncbi:hypothetical protein QE410_002280 [Microbacterium sp. SORGH_AS 1204]|nr:hypothetical protein [Microbacterium sp. SORGH_AS_1204]
MAELAQPRDGAVDGAGVVQIVLVEVHVEVDAELVQRLLDLAEHEGHAELAEGLLLGIRLEGVDVSVVGLGHALRDVVDICTAITVFGRRVTLVSGDEAAGEAIDLGAVVVEVILAGDLGALRRQDAREGIAEGGPAGAAEVDRTGRVRADEFEVDNLVGAGVVGAERAALLDDRLGESACRRGIQADVDEARACDLDARDAVDGFEARGDLGGELARVGPDDLRQLQRGVGRPVAVVAVLRPLERQVGGREPGRRPLSSRLRERGDDGEQGGGEGSGIHSPASLGGAGSLPRLRTRRRNTRGSWRNDLSVAGRGRDSCVAHQGRGRGLRGTRWRADHEARRMRQPICTRDSWSSGAAASGTSSSSTASTCMRSSPTYPP